MGAVIAAFVVFDVIATISVYWRLVDIHGDVRKYDIKSDLKKGL